MYGAGIPNRLFAGIAYSLIRKARRSVEDGQSCPSTLETTQIPARATSHEGRTGLSILHDRRKEVHAETRRSRRFELRELRDARPLGLSSLSGARPSAASPVG